MSSFSLIAVTYLNVTCLFLSLQLAADDYEKLAYSLGLFMTSSNNLN